MNEGEKRAFDNAIMSIFAELSDRQDKYAIIISERYENAMKGYDDLAKSFQEKKKDLKKDVDALTRKLEQTKKEAKALLDLIEDRVESLDPHILEKILAIFEVLKGD